MVSGIDIACRLGTDSNAKNRPLLSAVWFVPNARRRFEAMMRVRLNESAVNLLEEFE